MATTTVTTGTGGRPHSIHYSPLPARATSLSCAKQIQEHSLSLLACKAFVRRVIMMVACTWCLCVCRRHATLDAFDQDPRLQLLDSEWFRGRHLLDVGCNEGLVTLAAAARWGTASATGVDIDPVLIGKASR